MENASETILALKPVTFRFKKEIDANGTKQFGLVAEEVEKVNPELVTRDEKGKPETVRYEAVNAMLLNEFLKEHKKVEEQNGKIQGQAATISQLKSTVANQEATVTQLRSTVTQQQKGMEALAAHLKEQDSKIQKVSDQLELSSPRRATQTVLNSQ